MKYLNCTKLTFGFAVTLIVKKQQHNMKICKLENYTLRGFPDVPKHLVKCHFLPNNGLKFLPQGQRDPT